MQTSRILFLCGLVLAILLFLPASTNARVTTDSVWSQVNHGVSGSVLALASSANTIYTGGYFDRACGNDACDTDNVALYRIGQWNGSAWSQLGFGLNSTTSAVALDGSTVYAGGVFDYSCDDATCNHLAARLNRTGKWNGSTWSALGNGVSSSPSAIVVNGSDIYFGGFKEVCGNVPCDSGNTTVNYVAKWDGANWSALGYGLNAGVIALAMFQGNLYAAGDFTGACNDSACTTATTGLNHIAKWNGSSWVAVGNGVNDRMNVLASDGTNLYAGGGFFGVCGDANCTGANQTRVNYIAKWDGSAWGLVGFGFDKAVTALATSGSWVYAGGELTRSCSDVQCASGTMLNHVGAWNGSDWVQLGNGVDGQVTAMTTSGMNLFVGGVFTHFCGNWNVMQTTLSQIISEKFNVRATQTDPSSSSPPRMYKSTPQR